MTLIEAIKTMQKTLNEGGANLSVDGIWGPITQSALDAALIPKKGPTPVVPNGPTPWMSWIEPHIGEKEIYGRQDNPFIMSLYPDGNYPKEHDEVPWCACLANAALKRTGFKGTNSAAAASFDKYGTTCEPKFGAVITMRHSGGGRHVTFFHHWVDEGARIAACLGGNQGNALKISTFNLSGNRSGHDELVHCGWPVKV